MSGPKKVAEPAGAPGAPSAPAGPPREVPLLFGTTPTERDAVHAWVAADRGPGADFVEAWDPSLGSRLAAAAGDPLIVPARVAWLPPDDGWGRIARLARLVTLSDPRHPRRLAQQRIARREPERHRVIVGEAATLSDLHRRFEERTGDRTDAAYAAFVQRQGELALDRAERALVGERHKAPRFLSEEVLSGGRFRTRARRLAAQLDQTEEAILKEARGYLDEMAAMHQAPLLDAWYEVGSRVIRSYDVHVDEGQVEELRRLGRSQALAYLPSHRSYLDPIILRAVMHRHGLPPNHVLGGINVAFWPVRPIAKRSGVVFIRRSYKDKPVYSAVLREYIGYLVRKRFNLEWYIEGGRTRTGKLREPRFGILAYLVDALREGAVEDVTLVPTSIVYENLPEVGAIAQENLGAEKRKESIRWLVDYVRAQRRMPSAVHLRFGQPLALRGALRSAAEGAKVKESAGSNGAGAPPSRDLSVEKVAFEVLHRINRATPVTPTALVTLALLGCGDRALTLREVQRVLTPLSEYVGRRHIPLTDQAILERAEGLGSVLAALTRAGVVTAYADGPEEAWGVSPTRHLEAAFYRNSSVHFFVNRAIVELIAATAAERPFEDPVADSWQEALKLRDILKFEFFFPSKGEFSEEMREEMRIGDPDWEQHAGDPEEVRDRLEALRLHLAHRVIGPYSQAYFVVADRLAARDPGAPIEEKGFMRACLGAARQYRAQQRIWSTEAISNELFHTGLKLAANRGLVDPGHEELEERRREFAHEMRVLLRRVRTIRDLAWRDVDAELAEAAEG